MCCRAEDGFEVIIAEAFVAGTVEDRIETFYNVTLGAAIFKGIDHLTLEGLGYIGFIDVRDGECTGFRLGIELIEFFRRENFFAFEIVDRFLGRDVESQTEWCGFAVGNLGRGFALFVWLVFNGSPFAAGYGDLLFLFFVALGEARRIELCEALIAGGVVGEQIGGENAL